MFYLYLFVCLGEDLKNQKRAQNAFKIEKLAQLEKMCTESMGICVGVSLPCVCPGLGDPAGLGPASPGLHLALSGEQTDGSGTGSSAIVTSTTTSTTNTIVTNSNITTNNSITNVLSCDIFPFNFTV